MEKGGDRVGGIRGEGEGTRDRGIEPYVTQRKPASTVSHFLVFQSHLSPLLLFYSPFKNHSKYQLECGHDGAGERLLEKVWREKHAVYHLAGVKIWCLTLAF